MSTSFNGRTGLVVVSARIVGPSRDTVVRLAVDTGATATVVSAEPLRAVGIDPAASAHRVPITTGSGVEQVARVLVDRFDALGRQRRQFSVIAHTIPASAGVDGVLGLDFLRRCRVTLDFRAGRIFLA